MTDLDDALNRSNPMFHPVEIVANWTELPPGYTAGNLPTDDLRDLGQQIGPGGYVVNHSFDDGLPDPVTMTGQNDASGQFQAELVGRQQLVANNAGPRTVMTGGSGTGVTVIITPDQTSVNDYSVVGVVIPAATTYVTNVDPFDRHRWQLLGSQIDGTVQLLVFGRYHYTGAPSLVLTLNTSSAWVWTGISTVAETFPNVRAAVPLQPGTVVKAAETVSQTSHTVPNVYIRRRGWTYTFWAAGSSVAWTPGGDLVELSESAGSPRLMLSRTPLRPQQYTENLVASTGSATDVVAMIAVPVEIADRPTMDGLQYFSPFNKDSPIWDFQRDTAPVTVAQPVVSPVGVLSTQLFEGLMSNIQIKGRLVNLSALSKTKLDLDRMLTLPNVRGDREGCTVDWLVNWIMSRGGQYAGPGPSAYTRWWVPFYGSIHEYFGGPLAYASAQILSSDNPGVTRKYESPSDVRGPFVTGMHAYYTNDEVSQVSADFDRVRHPGGATDFGFDEIPLHTNDIMSQANNRGRMVVWLRGDDTFIGTPAAVVGAPAFTNTLFRWRMCAVKPDGSIAGEVNFIINANREIHLRLGSTLDGFTDLVMGSSAMPNDGEWHYYCLIWDWDAGSTVVRRDGTTWTINAWAPTTDANLPVTEEAAYASGGYIFQTIRSHVPVADFQLECGDVPWTEGTAGRFYPSLTPPSGNALYYPNHQWVEAVADETPVQGWSTLSELAQATLSHYRCDEEDNFNFLDLAYFGQTTQMQVSTVADTEVNTSDLDVTNDPSKTRNIVTMEFPETKVDTNYTRVMELASSLMIPRGVTTFVFTLDIQVGELYGASNPYFGSLWTPTKLTSGQIAAGTVPTNLHTMTVNTSSEGTGTVITSNTTFSARIVGYDSTTVTIRFTNGYSKPLYLANNGTDVPFLCILGYPVRVNTSYSTQSDPGSIIDRRQRSLSTSSRWIQRRSEAETVAGKLVNILSRPRAEVIIETMGDPRRIPGQVVELADSQGTRAEGTWRILSVTHNGNGPQFTQTLQLVRIYPISVWDDEDGWDISVWAE